MLVFPFWLTSLCIIGSKLIHLIEVTQGIPFYGWADCGSDHELLIAKFRLKLKKVGTTTRPFSYDLNQIPYDYTEEVRNWFKELDLIDRVPDELWMEICDTVQKTGIKTIPKKKKCKKAKWLSEEALTNSCEKKRSQKRSRKGKIYPFECRVPKNSKER